MSSASTDGPAARSAGTAAPVADRPTDDVGSDGDPTDPRGGRGETRSDPGAADRRWSRPVWAARTSDDDRSDLADLDPGRSRRRRWLVVAAAAVVLVGVAAMAAIEVLGRRYVADGVAEQLRASGISGDIDVSTTGGLRPVVVPAVLGRGLGELRIAVADGSVAGLPVVRADYVLGDIDAAVSLRTGEIDVRSIGSGRVRIEISPDALADAVGTDLTIEDGVLLAGPDRLVVDTEISGDALVLSGPAESVWGGPVDVPVADGYLLPCTPEVSIGRSTVVLACTGSTLPGVLRDPLGVGRGSGGGSTTDGSLVPPQSTAVDSDGGSTVSSDSTVSSESTSTSGPGTTTPGG